MEPATLYMLYKLADGTEHKHVGRFASKATCEAKLAERQEQSGPRYRITNAVCLTRLDYAPDWLSVGFHTDTLDPAFRPITTVPSKG
jgi:hypothetical protein